MKAVMVYLLIWLVAGVASCIAGGVSSLYSSEGESYDTKSRWQAVLGTIVDSKVAINEGEEPPNWNVNVWLEQRPHWNMTVWFTYVVKGERYTGEQGWYTDSNHKSKAKQEKTKYATGSAKTVYYDPANPARVVIEPEKPSMGEADRALAAVAVAGLLGALGTWVLAKRRGWV